MERLKEKEKQYIEEYESLTNEIARISEQSKELQRQHSEAVNRRNFVAGKVDVLRELMNTPTDETTS